MFLNRLSKETLNGIVKDLLGQRFADRDGACAALEQCKAAMNYGADEVPMIVMPSTTAKRGYVLTEVPDPVQAAPSKAPQPVLYVDNAPDVKGIYYAPFPEYGECEAISFAEVDSYLTEGYYIAPEAKAKWEDYIADLTEDK